MLVTIEGNYFSIMYIFEYDAKVAFPKTLQIASVCPIAKLSSEGRLRPISETWIQGNSSGMTMKWEKLQSVIFTQQRVGRSCTPACISQPEAT
jgi:hypothetical protein